MRLIDADEMAMNESEAYISAQTKIDSPITLAINSVAHRKIQQLIADTPTITPESLVVHGKWNRIDDPEYQFGDVDFECSVCEHLECDVDTAVLMPGENCLYYCPNCGAKMDLEEVP